MVHRKKKIIGLIIIVVLGIVVIAIFVLSPSDQSSAFSGNARQINSGGVQYDVCSSTVSANTNLDTGEGLWEKVMRGLENSIGFDSEDREKLMSKTKTQLRELRERENYLDDDNQRIENWNYLKGKMKSSCIEIEDPQDLCIFAESFIRACATWTYCNNEMSQVTRMLGGGLMCAECGYDPDTLCTQWPYDSEITDSPTPEPSPDPTWDPDDDPDNW